MNPKIFFSILALGLMVNAFGQKPILELAFSAIDSAAYIQLDSIKVMNRTQGGDTVLFWPDVVLVLDYQVGIPETNNETGSLKVFQNFPNPVVDQTTISFYVPEKDNVSMIVSDMMGRVVLTSNRVLDKGTHSIMFTPGGGDLLFFTTQWRSESSTIKILQVASNSNGVCSLEFIGGESSSLQLKATEDIQSFYFSLGDELLYIGYSDTLQSGMLDTPETSEAYTFQFATNIPCLGTPTVTYGGQVYNTIQIFSQCWLKENLNVGTMIPGGQNMTDNSILEKYCYYNIEDSCSIFGGLYQWNEMMQYSIQEATQGICPPGWHLPTNEEWNVLEGAVDSQFGIGDPEWDNCDIRGFDAGTALKTTSGWYAGGNGTNLFGFSGLPGGYRNINGGFNGIGSSFYLWTSTEYYSLYGWNRNLYYYPPGVYRYNYSKEYGFSVRCLQD
ncbi:MAG: hypothetical protein HQ542_05970 [Bacteroidia bacterium]|nr:hypothetical protein [Bacteroidia bacterium]